MCSIWSTKCFVGIRCLLSCVAMQIFRPADLLKEGGDFGCVLGTLQLLYNRAVGKEQEGS